MGRNFDSFRRRRQDWPRRNWFEDLRRRTYRAPNGKLLGVFKGIADSRGYCVFWTRVIGVCVLLGLAGAFGAHGLKVTLLVAGFFYLLTALLMQPPLRPGEAADSTTTDGSSVPRGSVLRGSSIYDTAPPPIPPVSAMPRYPRPRVDLGQLDRQLDGLNRRIQRMETIVTDREYEWNRRMGI